MKKIRLIIILTLLLLFSYSAKGTMAYLNGSTLYYDGNTNKFTYINTNNTELFSSFKELMPGDEREESILFKGNNIKEGSTLFINLQDSNILDFIKVDIYENDKLILSNPSDDQILKKLNTQEEFTIKLKLKVDENASNEIEGTTKNLGISFLIKNENGTIINPKTSDNFKLYLYIGIMIVSVLGVIITFIYNKKQPV